MKKFRVGDISDRESNISFNKFGIVGKICTIDERYLQAGFPLIIIIKHFGNVMTSKIEEVEETEHGVLITTRNSMYRLDYIKEVDDNVFF